MVSQPVALVTGSSRGIGAAIASELAHQGHAVAVNYFRSPEPASRLVAQIRSAGGEAIALQGDVGQAADRQMLVSQTLDHYQRLDVLVNNAGITSPGRRDVLEATEESWDQVLSDQSERPVLSRSVGGPPDDRIDRPRFDFPRDDRQHFFHLGLRRLDQPAGLLHRESRNADDDLAAGHASGRRTYPCLRNLPWRDRQRHDGPRARQVRSPDRRRTDPIRRWGQPEDVARAVVTVVSDAFPFSTGERINVDGGFHIRRL